jgi:hypothetical protein
MLIRHYWHWINPGELSLETLARLGAIKNSSNQPTLIHPRQSRRFERGLTTMLNAKKCRNLEDDAV